MRAFMIALAATMPLLAGCSTSTLVRPIHYMMEDRGYDQRAVDNKIYFRMQKYFTKNEAAWLTSVNVDVWKSNVLLTGHVETHEGKERLLNHLKADERVDDVFDHLEVAAEGGGFKSASNDLWIEHKISAQLIGDELVDRVNYRWQCVNGHVYIMGEAKNRSEYRQMLELVRTVSGVQAVTPYVYINQD